MDGRQKKHIRHLYTYYTCMMVAAQFVLLSSPRHLHLVVMQAGRQAGRYERTELLFSFFSFFRLLSRGRVGWGGMGLAWFEIEIYPCF